MEYLALCLSLSRMISAIMCMSYWSCQKGNSGKNARVLQIKFCLINGGMFMTPEWGVYSVKVHLHNNGSKCACNTL